MNKTILANENRRTLCEEPLHLLQFLPIDVGRLNIYENNLLENWLHSLLLLFSSNLNVTASVHYTYVLELRGNSFEKVSAVRYF